MECAISDNHAYFGFVMCNGSYNKGLFSLKVITFAALLGFNFDKENVLEFLNSSVWKKNRENIFVFVDTEKEELEAEWKKFREKIKAVAMQKKRKIYVFVYYSGHGVTVMFNGQQMTCMVHPRYKASIESLMKMMPKADE